MKNRRQIFNSFYLKKYRRKLRNNLTPAEATLWRYLKNKQLDNRRFRRQFSIKNYIIDFYCPSEKLAVELDGDQHYTEEGIESDLNRDFKLKLLDIKILRFENVEVFENIEGVLERIKKEFNK